MRWRIGILYRSIDLLQLLSARPSSENDLMASFSGARFRNVQLNDVLEACHFNGWAERTEDNQVCCTQSGRHILDQQGYPKQLRKQIASLLEKENPLWASSSVQGRQALAAYAPPEAVQCFREAGLLDGQDAEVVAWWDTLAAKYRAAQDAIYLEIGRQGEKYTVNLELSRTGRAPKWIALEYSDAGYDVVSSVSQDDPAPLVIEVKTSTQKWNSAFFYLSRAEWDTLSNKSNAVIHLWSIHSDPVLHSCFDIAALKPHIPGDNGDGHWYRCRVPFSAFIPRPHDISPEVPLSS